MCMDFSLDFIHSTKSHQFWHAFVDIVVKLYVFCPHRYSWKVDGEELKVDAEEGVDILSEGSIKLMKPVEGNTNVSSPINMELLRVSSFQLNLVSQRLWSTCLIIIFLQFGTVYR